MLGVVSTFDFDDDLKLINKGQAFLCFNQSFDF